MATLNICEKFGKNIETHTISGSFREFLFADVEDYDPSKPLPFTVEMNGEPLDLDRQLIKSDVVTVTVEPKWMAIPYVIAVVVAAYSYYVASNIDKPDLQNLQRSTTPTGNSIYSANARANDMSPSGIVRTQSGRINTFPKYIIPPYSRFVDNKEIRYYMLSVGEGYYNYSQDNIYLAETPINRYIGDFKLDIYEPSDDVTGSDASEFWHVSKDVSGIRLTTSKELQFGTYTADFSGATITAKFDGIEAPFPFGVDVTFTLSAGALSGIYRAKSISGTVGQTATVVSVEKTYASLPVGALDQKINLQPGYKPPFAEPNFWTDSTAPSFTPVSDVVVDWESSRGGVNWEGPFVITPEGERTESFEIDFKFSQGLAKRDSQGNLINRTVVVQLAWRDYGDSEWIYEPEYSWTNNTLDELGFTRRVNTSSPVRPEIQFRRVTEEARDVSIYDVVDVVGVKAKLDVQGRYNDISTIALEVVGTEGLASTATQQINIRNLTRKLPTLAEIQALSWDLRDETTKAPQFWSFLFNRYRSAWNVNKTVNGVSLAYNNPSIDYNRAGNQMAVVLGGKWARIYYASNFACFPVDARSSFYDVELTSGSVDTIFRFGNDTHDKYGMVSIPGKLQVISLDTQAILSEFTFSPNDRQDIYSVGDGKVFFILYNNQALKLVFGTAWDLTTFQGSTSEFLPNNDAKSMYFGNGGLKWHLLRAGIVEEYTLSTAYNLATATLDGTITDFSANNPLFIVSSPDSFVFSEKEGDETAINQYYRQKDIDTRETRSIARFCAYSLWRVLGDNVVDQVDWDALIALDALWESREDYFDAEIADETTLWEVLKLALSVGYAEPTISGGLFTPVRVSSGTDYDQLYTPDIMTSELQFDQGMYDGSENDGLEIEYYDSQANINNTVLCLAGNEQGLRPSRAQSVGITDSNKAWRYGMRQRNKERYKAGTISFTTEMDALNSDYGRPVAVSHDMFLSQYGEVLNYIAGTLVLTLSFAPVFTAAQSHFVALRDLDGKVEFLSCTEISGNEVQLATAPAFTPVFEAETESTIASFGTEAEITKRGIVRNVEMASETSVRLVIEEYKSAAYQDDDSSVGGRPYILDGQVFSYNEFRPADGFVGYVKSGSGYFPAFYDIMFDNGTKISDDGFFELGAAPNISKLTMTAAGAANAARNNFGILPNTFFYNFKTVYAGGESEVQDITLKVLDTAFPPEDTLIYFPLEADNDGRAYDYLNKTFYLSLFPGDIESIDGLKNYGYAYRTQGSYSTAEFGDQVKAQTSGTWWFALDLSGSSGFAFEHEFYYDAPNSERLRIRYDSSNGRVYVEADNALTYEAYATPASTPTGVTFFSVSSTGTSHDIFQYPDDVGAITKTGDLSLDGFWYGDVNSSATFRRVTTDGNSKLVALGYSAKVLSSEELTRIAQIVREQD